MKSFYTVIVFVLCSLIANGQNTGTIAGKVIDGMTNEILPGLTISLPDGTAIVSAVDGSYTLHVAPGEYTLTFDFVGYSTKTVSGIEVKAGKVTEMNVTMELAQNELASVVITASAKKETVASVLSMQKNNASISDGISIESIRKSPDRNVGDVLKRVSGTSIQDDKFVVVRGLSDRYNIALLNGSLLPSTEPDRRAFSFDIVPSDLIDNILINKTASPDLPGDFSGGAIQIQTKDIPFSNFMSVNLGAGYNTISTGKDFRIGILNNSDYLGFDNGSRSFPDNFPTTRNYRVAPLEHRLAYSRRMRNNYGNRYEGNALPSMNLGFTAGMRKDLKNGGTIGTVFAVTYRNSQNLQTSVRRDYQTDNSISLDPSNLAYNFNDSVYSFNSTLGALVNIGYKKGNSKISFKNLVNRVFDITNLQRTGINYDNLQALSGNGSVTVNKSLINSNLEGEHKLSSANDKLKWNVNYTLTSRNQPDYRILPYAKSLNDVNDKDVPLRVVLRDTYRFWSELTDHAFGGNLNYSLPVNFLNERGTIKAGASAQYKLRDFSTRIFRYQEASPVLNPDLTSQSPENIFNDGHIYNQGFVLNEITNNNDKYDATSGLYAGYLMYDGRIFDKLRTVVGVRIENFGFDVNTADFSGQALTRVSRNYIDVLPSLNITYELNPKSNLRFSASRTVSRPELREVANFAYYDFVRNALMTGNTKLERSQNTNLDLRFETYPTSGEIFSVSGFYKHFKNPIEQVVLGGSVASNLNLSFSNQNAARSYGAEVEIRKRLDFTGQSSFLDNMMFHMNAAYIFSNVDFAAGNASWDADRPMQGQSPYLFNAGLQYTTTSNKVSFSALFNRIGPRISAVGFQGYPDIYENARSVVDFQVAIKVMKERGEFKFNVSDLLNQRAVFYQNVDAGSKRGYDASTDRIQYNYLYGTNLSIGFGYRF